MTFVTKCYIKSKNGQIHLRMSPIPEGTIPLVMLHQTASSSVMYEALMEKFDGFDRGMRNKMIKERQKNFEPFMRSLIRKFQNNLI